MIVADGTQYVLVWFDDMDAWALMSMMTMPIAVVLFLHVRKNRGPILNTTLAQTAKLLFVFAALYSAGVVIGAL